MRPLESVGDTAAHTTLLPECYVPSLLSHSFITQTDAEGLWVLGLLLLPLLGARLAEG